MCLRSTVSGRPIVTELKFRPASCHDSSRCGRAQQQDNHARYGHQFEFQRDCGTSQPWTIPRRRKRPVHRTRAGTTCATRLKNWCVCCVCDVFYHAKIQERVYKSPIDRKMISKRRSPEPFARPNCMTSSTWSKHLDHTCRGHYMEVCVRDFR